MEDKSVKKQTWDSLLTAQQEPYLARAEYLITKGYMSHNNMYTLAELIYNKEHG
jgi:hypothetical protein